MDEEVLAIKREKLFGKNDERAFSGFRSIKEFQLPKEVIESAEFLFRRSTNEKQKIPVENDPAYKQIVSYYFATYKGQIFCYKRTKKTGETRLHDNYSIGIGGHINPIDSIQGNTKEQIMLKGAARELEEEIKYDGEKTITQIGFINDDSNDVGKMHLGLVAEVKLQSPNAQLREDVYSEGGMKSIEEIKKHYAQLETWSQIIFNYILTQKDFK